jgi:uncharacterized membrane protein HdeD (DUF308 family)
MTIFDTASGLTTPPTWMRTVLGIVLILAGIIVLGDVALATIISTMFLGVTAIIAGAFEAMHAFGTKGWGSFLWRALLGVLYVAFGIVLLRQPVSGALILTYFLGLLLGASGIVRIFLGLRHWSQMGWIMLLSGAFGIVAGLIILSGWPVTGLWVLGFFLGVDLLSHGIAWLIYSWLPMMKTAAP